jgi:hypothetical protein
MFFVSKFLTYNFCFVNEIWKTSLCSKLANNLNYLFRISKYATKRSIKQVIEGSVTAHWHAQYPTHVSVTFTGTWVYSAWWICGARCALALDSVVDLHADIIWYNAGARQSPNPNLVIVQPANSADKNYIAFYSLFLFFNIFFFLHLICFIYFLPWLYTFIQQCL